MQLPLKKYIIVSSRRRIKSTIPGRTQTKTIHSKNNIFAFNLDFFIVEPWEGAQAIKRGGGTTLQSMMNAKLLT